MRNTVPPWWVAAVMWLLLVVSAHARDDGRYAQSPNRDWFRSLQDKHGMSCCDGADGMRLEDPDWEFNGDAYRVRLNGDWYAVSSDQVVTDNNRVGYAIVWPWMDSDGKLKIRCFLPGSGT